MAALLHLRRLKLHSALPVISRSQAPVRTDSIPFPANPVSANIDTITIL